MPRRRDWTLAREKVDTEGSCRVCGSHYRPEAAHVIPRSVAPNGGESADAIVPLCRACHTNYDSHQLDLLKYLTVDEQVHAVRVAPGIEMARRVITGER